MFDERTFAEERQNTLSDEDLLKVLDSLVEFEKKWNCHFSSFALSGGDPLSRPGWDRIVSALREKGKLVGMLGNPEQLSSENIKLLKSVGLSKYQMSLDGLEEDHDKFRSKGSFQRTIKKISELEESGIPCQIMFTLYPENEEHLFPLIKFLSENTPLSFFSFDIGTSAGNAGNLRKDLDKAEIKEILEKYLLEKERLIKTNKKLFLKEKSHFFSLYRLKSNPDDDKTFSEIPIIDGCIAAWHSVAILSDGRLMACRRMPVTVGKMPEKSFEELFLGDPFFKKLRRRSSYEGCCECTHYKYCRGCPAYSDGERGNPFAENPLCFKEMLSDNHKSDEIYNDPPMTTTFEEEYDYICSAFRFSHDYFHARLKADPGLRLLFLQLMDDQEKIKKFLENSTLFMKDNGFLIDGYDLLTLKYYLNRTLTDGLLNREDTAERIKYFVDRLKLFHLRKG